MKTSLIFIILIGTALIANSQTSIPGGNVYGTWTLAGSPYLVQGSIMIPDDSTLTIQPGVTVNFQGHYKLLVTGRLLAMGTITDSIFFTTANTTTGWYGIRIDNTPSTNDTSKIIYCNIQWGNANGSGNDANGGACIINNFSKVIISNCLIKNNSAISGGGGGIYCSNASPTISNNNFTGNSSYVNAGAIYADIGCNSAIFNNTISYNSCAYGSGGGITCNIGNGGALYCANSSNLTIRNCILYNNTAVISGEQVFLYDELSDPNFYYCDVQGASTAFGLNGNFYTGIYQNNINADPLFASPSGGSGTGYNGITADWSLQSTSPCIDAGDPSCTYPATDIAGNPRVVGNYIDIGAYEYQGVTAIVDYDLQNQIIIYPNPFNNSATIQLITNVKYSELNVYNMSGQK